MSHALMPDLDQATRFLCLLDPDAEQYCFRTFSDGVVTTEFDPWAKTFPGPLDVVDKALRKMQKHGAGVFVTINETDGSGQKASNITRVRAVFADLDGAPLEPVLTCELQPHMVVESSPGKFHAYWLVEDLPLDQFEGVQRSIAQQFEGDKSVNDLPRVMRLPGFVHQKGEPFVSRIVQSDERLPYTAAEICASFPPVQPRSEYTSGNGHDPDAEAMAALVKEILHGDCYHDALRNLAWRHLLDGMAPQKVVMTLRGIMEAAICSRDGRWLARYNEIPKVVRDGEKKLAREKASSAGASAGESGGTAPPRKSRSMTLSEWRKREIPEIDYRLGHLFSTSSRALLIGPTGAGKTLLAMAWTFALSTGTDFLHWPVGKPSRVLYIDAELPQQDLMARLELAAQWFDKDPGDNLRILSADDFDGEPITLDTEGGQRIIWDEIAEHPPEFIIFDNTWALSAGSMKEPDSERALRVFRQSLTQKGIGQLWLHHTGHDSSKGYGDKAREWGLDTVMMMEDQRPAADDDPRFKLKFTKARRRSGKTKDSYAEKVIALVPDMFAAWNSEDTVWEAEEPAKEPTKADEAQGYMLGLIERLPGRTRGELRRECDPELVTKSKNEEAIKKAVNRAIATLIKTRQVEEDDSGRLYVMRGSSSA